MEKKIIEFVNSQMDRGSCPGDAQVWNDENGGLFLLPLGGIPNEGTSYTGYTVEEVLRMLGRW